MFVSGHAAFNQPLREVLAKKNYVDGNRETLKK